GALSVQLARRAPETSPQYLYISPIYTPPASYVFVVPKTADELDEKVADGLRYLISYLPSFFACGNQVGDDPCHKLQPPFGTNDTSVDLSKQLTPGNGDKR